MTKKKLSTKQLVLGAVLTALVILLQYIGSSVKFGPFSISLVLIPIVIGAATCGPYIASWLGLVFGVIVIASGDAAPFLTFNAPGTFATVLSKGILCGLLSSIAYLGSRKALGKIAPKTANYLAVVVAAIVCPVVNTGVFLLGCKLFFMPLLETWAGGGNIVEYMFLVLVGVNFLVELAVNVVLSPVAARLISIRKNS